MIKYPIVQRPVDKNIQSSSCIRETSKFLTTLHFFYICSPKERKLTKKRKKEKRRSRRFFGMERQKSMEKGLLRKSLSIRERKFPNEDAFLEAGLSRKSPREVKKPQNDDGECRVTASVFLSTFVAVSGSFCTGCGVSLLFSIRFRFRSVYINRFLL